LVRTVAGAVRQVDGGLRSLRGHIQLRILGSLFPLKRDLQHRRAANYQNTIWTLLFDICGQCCSSVKLSLRYWSRSRNGITPRRVFLWCPRIRTAIRVLPVPLRLRPRCGCAMQAVVLTPKAPQFLPQRLSAGVSTKWKSTLRSARTHSATSLGVRSDRSRSDPRETPAAEDGA
jgi:hypothetical protein